MPGRVSRATRPSANSTDSRKSSTQTLKSARNSSAVAELPDEGDVTTLRRAICTVFSDAQKSTAGHRKLVISLRKIQEQCCYEPVDLTKGKREAEDFDEDDFNVMDKREAQRVATVIREAFSVEFEPDVIIADASVSKLAARIRAAHKLLRPFETRSDS